MTNKKTMTPQLYRLYTDNDSATDACKQLIWLLIDRHKANTCSRFGCMYYLNNIHNMLY